MGILFCHRTVINASFRGSGEQGQAYFKERTGSEYLAHQTCNTSTELTIGRPFGSIMAYPHDKSMTKIGGNVHVAVM
jgi:hypothetical protein